eukprot:3613427-Rhodomonas_salina.1
MKKKKPGGPVSTSCSSAIRYVSTGHRVARAQGDSTRTPYLVPDIASVPEMAYDVQRGTGLCTWVTDKGGLSTTTLVLDATNGLLVAAYARSVSESS